MWVRFQVVDEDLNRKSAKEREPLHDLLRNYSCL